MGLNHRGAHKLTRKATMEQFLNTCSHMFTMCFHSCLQLLASFATCCLDALDIVDVAFYMFLNVLQMFLLMFTVFTCFYCRFRRLGGVSPL